jgi:hypothetical protein
MEIGKRLEALREPADDRERHRQAEHPCANGRLGRSSDGDPHRERILDRTRVDAVAGRRASRLADEEELLQPLLEEPVVVAEVEAEERERLDERAAPNHHLRASAGEEIERCELLEEANRDGRAEHADRAREPDAPGAHRRGCEHDGRGGHGELRAMVLSDAEDVETYLVGELDLLHEVAQALFGPLALSHVREREDADLHGWVLPCGAGLRRDAWRRP